MRRGYKSILSSLLSLRLIVRNDLFPSLCGEGYDVASNDFGFLSKSKDKEVEFS